MSRETGGSCSRLAKSVGLVCTAALLASAFPAVAEAQDEDDPGATLELYGQVTLDAGHGVNAFEPGGQTYISVRRTWRARHCNE